MHALYHLYTYRKVREICVPVLMFCSITDTKPEIATLNCFKYKDTNKEMHRYYIMDKIAAKWRRLGIALKFDTNSLDSIETTCNHDVEQCCVKMLTQWLDGYVKQLPITWRTLLEALRDVHMNQLAGELTELLGKYLISAKV